MAFLFTKSCCKHEAGRFIRVINLVAKAFKMVFSFACFRLMPYHYSQCLFFPILDYPVNTGCFLHKYLTLQSSRLWAAPAIARLVGSCRQHKRRYPPNVSFLMPTVIMCCAQNPASIFRGSVTIKTVPAPSVLSTSKVPPCPFVTISYASESPNPVPCPVGLVVKNG